MLQLILEYCFCTEIKCPEYVGRGIIDTNCKRVPSNICNYTCANGYKPSRAKTDLMCKPNGKWNISSAMENHCISNI